MLYRIRETLNRSRLDRALRPIMTTKPIRADGANILVFSAVSHRDLLMYLAAVKSLLRFLPPSGVVAMNDGSLTANDQAVLHTHLPGLRIVPGQDIETGKVPADFTWQRMFWSIKLAERAYVIQLDSDTLTLARPDAVLETISAGKSFILGTGECLAIDTVAARAAAVANRPSNNIQTVSERAMPGLPDAGTRRYVRGSAGFYGFGRGHVGFEDAETLFTEMNRLTDGRFIEYGSEQFAANFLVANTRDAVLLPFPTYAVHHVGYELTGAIFLHFIGSYRFHRGTYVKAAQNVISELQ